jgi:hypothetical protein
MMVFGLGDPSDLISQGDGLGKILELEDPLEALDAISLDDRPPGYVRLQPGDFGIVQGRLAAAAGDTPCFAQ